MYMMSLMKSKGFVCMLELRNEERKSGGVGWLKDDGKVYGDSNDERGLIEMNLKELGWTVVNVEIL
jgi:hypothetical protein